MMTLPVLIRREPVVNRQKAITATRLVVLAAEAANVADTLTALADVWPKSRTVLLSLGGVAPHMDLLDWLIPENTMIEIPAPALADPGTQSLLAELLRGGVPLCLDGYSPAMKLPPQLQFRFLLADANAYPKLASAPGLTIAKGLDNNAEFGAAVQHGYSGATGWFFLRGIKPSGKLTPSHAQLIQVLNLVRHNADMREIENALKRDVTLSFKLLRYINSAGFGLSCEIHSFRHAVSILGYDKLNKWLSLLLVTASKDPGATALMQTAIARGRFMEIVGAAFFGREQTDNLFITGAFSLLDLLLGAGLAEALEQMHLPEDISDAIIRHEGIYAPFLDLAIACESASVDDLMVKAEALQLTPERFNRAQLEALTFADSLQFG
jgi:EAL and modified HD-GYP domain-containing signal transduction protein